MRPTRRFRSPRTVQIHDAADDSLCAALETVFPLYTEDAIINWNHVYVPVSYKYDLSVMVDDVLQIIEALQSSPQGRLVNHWPSNTFAASWEIDWKDGMLKIHSEWTSVVGSCWIRREVGPDQVPAPGRLRSVLQRGVREGALSRAIAMV